MRAWAAFRGHELNKEEINSQAKDRHAKIRKCKNKKNETYLQRPWQLLGT
jgi:hypothetical protein